jgi:hypothetical protein
MKLTNATTGLDLTPGERPGKGVMNNDETAIANTPQQILQSVVEDLNQGRFSEVVRRFDDCFRYKDHALALEFTDKRRLSEFFEKSRELFPDTTLEVVALFEDRDHAIAVWKLAATQTVPYGSISWRSRISLLGTTIVHVENKRIVEWSDYYDQNSSRRVNLAAFFTDWIEY